MAQHEPPDDSIISGDVLASLMTGLPNSDTEEHILNCVHRLHNDDNALLGTGTTELQGLRRQRARLEYLNSVTSPLYIRK